MEYRCDKCGHDDFETDTFSATGGTLSKLFDIQNKRFTTVSCTRCGYTELFKGTVGDLENVFDWLVGS